jgi:alpha-N-arabinofuranosidase
VSTQDQITLSRRGVIEASAALGLAAALPASATAAEGALSATINATNIGPPLSPLLYGGFLEHIGGLINANLWSELLDDRKFYYGVLETLEPPPTGFRAAARYTRKWTAVGPMAALSLDRTAPYVGEHSPVIEAGANPRGVAQSGLALIRDKTYVGRVVVAADPGIDITATLIWGSGRRDRQSVRVAASDAWTTQPLNFTARASTNQGRLEITGLGAGAFRVGAVSLMPSDNVRGFRADAVAALRDMDCKMLRMPGGNFVSAYDWKNTIGDPDKRPPILDPVWNAVQPNDVGVDELLQLCEVLNVAPSWCVSTGFDDPRSGAEQVEYVNGAANTLWGAQRAANGHPEPYRVKYWNIGNEMYGRWQMGHMALSQYVVKHNLFADAMRKVDPSIYIIAPGGFVDEMTTGQGIMIAGQPQVEFGSERDWAGGMLTHCWGKFDALATHAYPPENKRFNLTTGQLFDVTQPLEEWARQPANRVRTMCDCWEEYKRRHPRLNEGGVKVFFDEWAYSFQRNRKSCLAVAMTLHEFFRHSDFIDMAGYTMATGWLEQSRTETAVSAIGRTFQLYNRHFGKIPVAVTGNAPVPAPQYPIGGDQPRVNAGSDTYPLDVSAALTADRSALIVAVVNPTEAARSLRLRLDGFSASGAGRAWTLTGSGLDAQNRVGQPPQVTIAEAAFDAAKGVFEIAPIGIELYEFRAA